MTPDFDQHPLARLLARIDARSDGDLAHDGVTTGFPSVDKLLGGGLRIGELTVLGGDVGCGKSALALAMAIRAADAGHPTMFLTSELSSDGVHERALSIEGRVRIDDLRNGRVGDEMRAALGVAVHRLRRSMPLTGRLPAGVGAIADAIEMRRRHGDAVTLLVLDPLQGLATGHGTQDEELAAATRALKALALDLDLAVLLTAHVPMLSPRDDMRPLLDDFGTMGAVKQHADCVLALFREGMYDAAQALEGATELIVRKRRHGVAGYVDLYYYAHWLRFEDMLEPDR